MSFILQKHEIHLNWLSTIKPSYEKLFIPNLCKVKEKGNKLEKRWRREIKKKMLKVKKEENNEEIM